MTTLSILFGLCATMGVACVAGVITTIKRSGLWAQRCPDLPATCDLLDYATQANDHVIVLKSGGLMSLYELTPPDLGLMSEAQVALTYELAQKALLKLVGNYCIHVDLIRNRDEAYYPELEADAGTCGSTHQVLQELEDARVLYCAQHPIKVFNRLFFWA